MAKYKRKPLVVEATQWFKNGDHPIDACDPCVDEAGHPFQGEGHVVRYFRHPYVPGDSICKHCKLTMHVHGWIDTLEGGHNVCPGDWIITGVKGEHYPVKDAIFAMIYDPVEPKPLDPEIEARLEKIAATFTLQNSIEMLESRGYQSNAGQLQVDPAFGFLKGYASGIAAAKAAREEKRRPKSE